MRSGIVIVVTSGKGGTGKTSVTAGVGAALAALDRKVLCLDADLCLRNLDLCMGLSDQAVLDFSDVLSGACTLEQAAVPHPTRSGLALLAAPFRLKTAPDEAAFGKLLDTIREQYDFCLIDSPAGLDTGFHLAGVHADRGLVVATGDASSLRDAQRAAEELRSLGVTELHLVVNRVRKSLLRRMALTVDDAMDQTALPLLGLIPEDDAVPLANNAGRLLTPTRRGAAAAYRNIARRLCGESVRLLKL